jgi:hypothetical protein
MKSEIRVIGLLILGLIVALSSCSAIEDFADDDIDIQGAGLAGPAEKATDSVVAQLTRMADQATRTAAEQLTVQATQVIETEAAPISIANENELITVFHDHSADCLDSTGHSATACTFDIELAVIALVDTETNLETLREETKAEGIDRLPQDFTGAFPAIVVHVIFVGEWDPLTGYICIEWADQPTQNLAATANTSGNVASSCNQPGGSTWTLPPSAAGVFDHDLNAPGLQSVYDALGMTFVQTLDTIYMGESLSGRNIRIYGTANDQSNIDVLDIHIPY